MPKDVQSDDEIVKSALAAYAKQNGVEISIRLRHPLDNGDDLIAEALHRKLDEILVDLTRIFRRLHPDLPGEYFVEEIVNPACTFTANTDEVLIAEARLVSKRVPRHVRLMRMTMVKLSRARLALQTRDLVVAVQAAIDASLGLGVLAGMVNAPGAHAVRMAKLVERDQAYGPMRRLAQKIAIGNQWNGLKEAAEEILAQVNRARSTDPDLAACEEVREPDTVEDWLRGLPDKEFRRLFPYAAAARDRQRAREERRLVSFGREMFLQPEPSRGRKPKKSG